MHARTILAALVCTAVLAGAGSRTAARQMPTPKPGPEHEVLKADVGTWDAKVELIPAPGVQPIVSKGVETNTLGCGGLCLISDFKGEMAPGQAFHGHGVTTWDPAKKKYVGSWTDSMSAGLAVAESTYDASKKTAAGWMESPDPATGKPVKMRMVSEYPSPTGRAMTAYATGPDGKEFVTMRITYTRAK